MKTLDFKNWNQGPLKSDVEKVGFKRLKTEISNSYLAGWQDLIVKNPQSQMVLQNISLSLERKS